MIIKRVRKGGECLLNRDSILQEIYNTINELIEVEKKDEAYIKVVEDVFENVYAISKEANMDDIFIAINDIETVMRSDDNDQKIEKYLKKLNILKGVLEQYIVEKSRVLLFSEVGDELRGLVDVLERQNIEVIVTKENILEAILFYNPIVVVIQNNISSNLITVLKSIRDEKLLDHIPIVLISDADYNTKMECLKLGVIDYFNNNFDINEVCLKILNLIKVITKYQKDSIYDIVTGLYTRKHGENLITSLLNRIRIEGKEAVVLIVDFDFMAEINRRMGISVGNRIISKVISEFKKYMNENDIAYRIAGDEFLFAFYGRDALWVKNIAEEVLEFSIKYGDEKGLKVSFSAGLLPISKDYKDYHDVILKAREALAMAKIGGRGKIVLYTDSFKSDDRKNILFVDDDKIILSILKSRYENKGFNVFTASDGTEALNILKDNKIDLVVTDYYLKQMNGDELIKKIREIYNELPIIVLSSQKNEDYIKRTLEIGANDYVVKPFSPVELDSRIKKLL